MNKIYIYNRNSKNRSSLDGTDIRTIKFKLVFPDYTEFQKVLTKYKITDPIVTEQMYKYMDIIIGNSYLLYTTKAKNEANLAMSLENNIFKYNKDKVIADLNMEDMLKVAATSEQTLYTIDRTNHNIVLNDYIDNKVKHTGNSRIAVIDRLKELIEFNSMNDPKMVFINRVISDILSPVQPDSHSEII